MSYSLFSSFCVEQLEESERVIRSSSVEEAQVSKEVTCVSENKANNRTIS